MVLLSPALISLATIFTSFAGVAPALAQTWSNSQLLNLPGESPQGAIKKPEVCRSASGGFHILYRHHLNAGGAVPMKYRRYFNGNLGSMVTAANVPNYAWDQYVCEAGNGDIHISWENWDATPNAAWTKSTNGGASFAPYIELTNFPASAKAPRIAPVGAANSPDVMLVVANPDDTEIYYNRYNGTSWSGTTWSGIGYATEYQVYGIARSPLDGSIYAVNDSNNSTVTLMHYTSFWSSTDVHNPGFFARQADAVNEAGQVMVCWEYNNGWYSRLLTPSTGWGPVQTVNTGGFGSVIAIPGTSSFYSAYSTGSSPLRIRGKMYTGGSWGAEEVISVGLPDAQALDPRVAIATDGSMFCCWEWWGNGNAEGWYSVRSAPAQLPTGTLAGTVRDQFGAGVAGVGISTTGAVSAGTGAGGVYSVTHPVGTFSVTAMKPAYTSDTKTGIVVTQGQTTTVNLTVTGQPPASVTGFNVVAGNTVNTLSWNNPSSGQYNGTRIVYKTTGYPSSPTDGTVFVDEAAAPGSSRSLPHSGITNGVIYYYRAYAYYQDASRFYAGGVDASGTPSLRVDFDHDGDVDLSDFAFMQRCLTGPNIVVLPPCSMVDLEPSTPDGDVDQADMGVFLGCLSGPDVYATPNCLN